MVALKTAIEELNTNKINFENPKGVTTMTTEGEVVTYLDKLQNIYDARNIIAENKPRNINMHEANMILDVIDHGIYADIFKDSHTNNDNIKEISKELHDEFIAAMNEKYKTQYTKTCIADIFDTPTTFISWCIREKKVKI